EVIRHSPSYAEARYNLGNALLQLRDYDGAISAYESALRLRADYPSALTNLARAYTRTLQHDLALEALRRAARMDPTPLALSNLAYAQMFSAVESPAKVAETAQQWDERFAKPLISSHAGEGHANARDPEKVLRIGYVGPTFRQHAVGYLIEPVLANH